MTEPRDELLERYAEAAAQDPRRPSERVRHAARAHAQMLRDQAAEVKRMEGTATPKAAANQPQWTYSLVASLAVVGLAGLLYVKIDRGAPQDREIALGAPAPSPAPAPPPNSTVVARTDTAQAPQPKLAEPHRPAAPPNPTQTMQDAAHPTANRAPTQVYSGVPAEANLPAKASGRAAEQIASGEAESVTRAAPVAPAAPAVAAAPPPPPPHTADAPHRARGLTAGPTTTQFLEAAKTGDIASLQELVAQGAAINSRDNNGNTALMFAARHGQAAAVRKLLEMGADTSLLNKEGLTALRIAEQMGFAGIVQLLQASR